MSEANLNQEPRIGIFLCDCGTNISSIIDVPQVIEASKGYLGLNLWREIAHSAPALEQKR